VVNGNENSKKKERRIHLRLKLHTRDNLICSMSNLTIGRDSQKTLRTSMNLNRILRLKITTSI
jgi:hypothetical protein